MFNLVKAYRIALNIVLLCLISLSDLSADSFDNLSNKSDLMPDVAEKRQDIEVSKSVIKEIKLKEPFINIQEERIWSFFDDEDELDDEVGDNAWLSDLIEFVAIFIEAALWLAPVVLALYVYRYRDYCMSILTGKSLRVSKSEIPDSLFGLDITEKSLPDDIEGVAFNLWQEKMYREAVSLLYRGALASLFKQYKFNLSRGATEHECVRQIVSTHLHSADNVHDRQRIEHFKQLTNVWIDVAYAHRIPAEATFESICTGWNKLFVDIRDGG